MRPLPRIRIAFWCAVAGCAQNPPPAAPPSAERAATAASKPQTRAPESPPTLQLPRDVHPLHYALEMRIVPDEDRFSGTARIDVQLDEPREVIWLHGRGLEVREASVSGKSARYEQVNPEGLARLVAETPVPAGKTTLQLVWERNFDPQIVGLYRTQEAGRPYAYTQFEAVDARRAFPGFDEPDFKTPFDVTLTVPADQIAVANTAPIAEEKVEAGLKKIRFATTKPLPTYLLLWAVGPFDVVAPQPLAPSEVRSRPLQVRGVAPNGRGAELEFALKTGADLLLLLERYFGTGFPFEKLDHVAAPDYSYGAMENAGAILYREDILLYEAGVSSDQTRMSIAGVMSHEMAHQWFGDLVTLRWWTDAWLNESFATWMGNRTVEEWDPSYGAWNSFLASVDYAMEKDALASARAVRQPLDDIKNVWNQFDSITYQKGGGVLAMFERFLGKDRFRDGIRRYLRAHAYGGGDTDDLLDALSEAAGKDVKTPFHTFLDQAGIPLIDARVECAAGRATLSLRQQRYLPIGSEAARDRVWQIPVCARYAAGGNTEESCAMLSGPTGALPLESCPTWILPNADAAGYYRWSLAPEELRKLTGLAYAKLSPRERISVAQNVRAAMRSGTLAFAEGMSVISPMAADSNPQVAAVPLEVLTSARDDLVPDATRERVERVARQLYRPVARRLGWAPQPGEPLPVRSFRAKVLGFLAFTARDQSVLTEAARHGRAYAGIADGKFHPDAVDPSLAAVALAAAVRTGDAKTFDALLSRLPEVRDGALRRRILGALSATEDAGLRERVLKLPLDDRLRKNERVAVLFDVAAHGRSRDAAWTALEHEFDRLVPVVPEAHASALIGLAGEFCDGQHLEQAQAFFAKRAPRVAAGTRQLAETLEHVRLCIAYRDAQGPSAERFFARVSPPRPR